MARIPPVVAGITIRASEDRLREMSERLHRWVEEVSRKDDASQEHDDSAKMEYAGLVMFFPTEPAPPADAPPTPS
jgi:hypothetical protein